MADFHVSQWALFTARNGRGGPVGGRQYDITKFTKAEKDKYDLKKPLPAWMKGEEEEEEDAMSDISMNDPGSTQ